MAGRGRRWAPRGPPRPPGFLLTFPSSERCVAWALSRGVPRILIDSTLPGLRALGGSRLRGPLGGANEGRAPECFIFPFLLARHSGLPHPKVWPRLFEMSL